MVVADLVFAAMKPYLPEVLVFALGGFAFAVSSVLPQEQQLNGRIVLPDEERMRAVGDAVEPQLGDQELWIRDEVLYREALRLGLDQEDAIVRRRLIQKMEYLLEGMAQPPDPTEAELQDYLLKHSSRYLIAASYSFEHVFFPMSDGAMAARDEALEALQNLRGGSVDPTSLGAPYPDGRVFTRVSEKRLQRLFGEAFVRELHAAPDERWHGPLSSRHGVHLVRRSERLEAYLPTLTEVSSRVVRDWLEEQTEQLSAQRFAELQARYESVDP